MSGEAALWCPAGGTHRFTGSSEADTCIRCDITRQDARAQAGVTASAVAPAQPVQIGNLSTGELLDYEPLNPVEVEAYIVELSERVEANAAVLADLWKKRYDAEREYIAAKARARLEASHFTLDGDKRAWAELQSADQLRAFHDAKTAQHAADELQRALIARLYGLLNINKHLTAAYQGAGRG